MNRSAKIAIMIVAFITWGGLVYELYQFQLVDACLDAGGVIDSQTRVCYGTRSEWSFGRMTWQGWLLIAGLPAVLVAPIGWVLVWLFSKFIQ